MAPTVELAKRNSKQLIDPLIEESEVPRLTVLAPDILEAVLAGSVHQALRLDRALPTDWEGQRAIMLCR